MKKFLSGRPAQPLIYAICIVVGLLAGKKLYQGQSYQLGYTNAETSKGKLYEILKKIDEHYVDSVDFKNLEELTIANVLENLDPHSYYLSAKDMTREDERLNGNFNGIGVEFKIIDDTIVVLRAIKDGPSFFAGVELGDKILAVNDQNFTGDSITSQLAMKYLKGEKGSSVKVTFLRGTEILNLLITRGEIPLNSIDLFTVLNNEIGYLKISRFSKRTTKEFNEATEQLLSLNVKSFILDVRDNPGGLMGSVVEVCETLLDKGKLIVSTEGRTENEEDRTDSRGKLANYPVYVLINENSASASEILAGAIQDNDRGTVIGRRSFGKGLVQRPFTLRDGSALRLTIARYFTPTGRCIQRSYEQGSSEYYKDNYSRMQNGELSSADSIPVPDSLLFYTPKGKLVYGGGGIIPDYFISTDTSALHKIAIEIFNKHYIDRFFLGQINLWEKLMRGKDLPGSYLLLTENNRVWNKFKQYIKNQPNQLTSVSDFSKVKNRIEPILLSKILRLKFNELGQHYPHLNSDLEILKAIELHFDNKPITN
jgi:carboxyl-terminal processing protease